MKPWSLILAAFATIALPQMSAHAQRIIQIPSAGAATEEAPRGLDQQIPGDQEQRGAAGCWISTEQVDTASGSRMITRQVCH